MLIERLDRILSVNLRESPLTWSYFAFHWRAVPRLFVSRWPSYPILDIYTVDEETRTVDILHFWNAMRDLQAPDL